MSLEDSESEDVTPILKKRRDNVSASRKTHRSPDSPQRHPQNILSKVGSSNTAKSRRPTAASPPVVDLVEPVLHTPNEHLTPENTYNNGKGNLILRSGIIDVDNLPAASKESTTRNAASTTNGTVARADATISHTNNNTSKRATTSNSVATSDMQKRKSIAWNRKHPSSPKYATLHLFSHIRLQFTIEIFYKILQRGWVDIPNL